MISQRILFECSYIMQDYCHHMTIKSHNTRFSHQNVKISPLENATSLSTSTHHKVTKPVKAICIFNNSLCTHSVSLFTWSAVSEIINVLMRMNTGERVSHCDCIFTFFFSGLCDCIWCRKPGVIQSCRTQHQKYKTGRTKYDFGFAS